MQNAARKCGAAAIKGKLSKSGFAPDASLEENDGFCLGAAEGWIRMGDYAAAAEKLAKISPGQRAHLAVLRVSWQLFVATKNWQAALDVASTMVRLKPDDSLGWAHQSFALHELQRTAEARDQLQRVADKFSGNATMRYNLACYECCLGNLDEAKGWLAAAFVLGNQEQTKKEALADKDLRPIHAW